MAELLPVRLESSASVVAAWPALYAADHPPVPDEYADFPQLRPGYLDEHRGVWRVPADPPGAYLDVVDDGGVPRLLFTFDGWGDRPPDLPDRVPVAGTAAVLVEGRGGFPYRPFLRGLSERPGPRAVTLAAYHAVLAAASADAVAGYAEASRASEARRWRAEAEALRVHADASEAAVAALGAGWWPEVRRAYRSRPVAPAQPRVRPVQLIN